MITHLRATNFALLSDVELELCAGLVVLTGETGAGKSLIVEAVNLLRGGRASADIPRAGADEAVVEAVVEVPAELRARVASVIDEAGLPNEREHVLVRRVIQRGGRSRCYVNGALTTAARLGELGALLVDLSSQHQHQGLVDPARHLHLLDAFGVDARALAAMADAWAELRRCTAAVDELASARGGDLDYLRFQVDELDAAALAPGEDAAIEVERARLAAVDTLHAAARGAEERLYGGDASARDLVAAAARELDRAARIDPALGELARRLHELAALADDIAGELRAYADRLAGDPERLAALDERIALIRRLARKHGAAGVDELVAKAAALRAELDALTSRAARAAELAGDRDRAAAAAQAVAAKLSARRQTAARALEKQVGAALAELGMTGARLHVAIANRDALGEHGGDRVELLLAANKGEDARPLAKIASGGELSRIMLAMKLALRRADPVATYVFDEVDAGIGGHAAQVVGKQIRALADGRQVLCVTHLPQIAAHADRHFHVDKHERGGRTETRVRVLAGAARQDELARMLGGEATSRARAHAAELLASTGKKRAS